MPQFAYEATLNNFGLTITHYCVVRAPVGTSPVVRCAGRGDVPMEQRFEKLLLLGEPI